MMWVTLGVIFLRFAYPSGLQVNGAENQPCHKIDWNNVVKKGVTNSLQKDSEPNGLLSMKSNQKLLRRSGKMDGSSPDI